MTDAFVPLVTVAAKPRENGFVSLHSAKNGEPAGNSAAPSPAPAPKPGACASPTVTLQRNGEVVTSIRVQCGCGQVVELACVY